MRLFVLLTLFLLSIPLQNLLADDPDFELEMTTTFEVDTRRGEYQLSSQTEVKRKYLSKRSTSITAVSIGEQFFDTITTIRATMRGSELRQGAFSFEHSPGSDVFISSLKVHTIHFPDDIEQGESIWYYYQRQYKGIAFMPIIHIPNIDYVKEYRVVIKHPDDVQADFEFFFPRDSVPYQILRPDDDETVLVFSNIRASSPLPGFPYNDSRGAVQVKLRNGTTALTPTTYTDFSRWYMGLFEQKPALDSAFKAILADELRGAKSDLEKIRIIHDHVRRNIRYIADEGAMHAFVPRDPSLVLRRGYGDCKDRAYLVSTLARREGIDVHMALVSTEPTPRFSGTHVSQYNHVICAYKSKGQWMFFDPTHKYCEFGNLPDGDIGTSALILDPQAPVAITIPPPNNLPSIEIAVTAKLDAPKEGKALITMRNDMLHAASEVLEKKTGLEQENILSNMVTGYFNKLSFDYFKVKSQSDSVITFETGVDLSDFVVSSTSKKYLNQMPFRIIDPELLNREQDQFAIHNPERTRISMTMDLDITGYSTEPGSLKFGEGDDVRFVSSMTVDSPAAARINYEVRHLAKQIDGNSRKSYLEFCRSFLKSKKNMFVFTKKEG